MKKNLLSILAGCALLIFAVGCEQTGDVMEGAPDPKETANKPLLDGGDAPGVIDKSGQVVSQPEKADGAAKGTE